jgi:hypothetical protein
MPRFLSEWIPPAGPGRWARQKRAIVLFFVVVVPWVPGAVTFAMLVSGNA